MLLTTNSVNIDVPTNCRGTGGYGDIASGTSVTVRDQAGTIIATGQLYSGTYNSKPLAKACTFAFLVPAIPDAPFYTVEVSHRGPLTYSRADLESREWKVDLTLGG